MLLARIAAIVAEPHDLDKVRRDLQRRLRDPLLNFLDAQCPILKKASARFLSTVHVFYVFLVSGKIQAKRPAHAQQRCSWMNGMSVVIVENYQDCRARRLASWSGLRQVVDSFGGNMREKKHEGKGWCGRHKLHRY